MKTETCKLYSRDFGIFPPNIIKIDPYNFELYRFKVGPFFESQCRGGPPNSRCSNLATTVAVSVCSWGLQSLIDNITRSASMDTATTNSPS